METRPWSTTLDPRSLPMTRKNVAQDAWEIEGRFRTVTRSSKSDEEGRRSQYVRGEVVSNAFIAVTCRVHNEPAG